MNNYFQKFLYDKLEQIKEVAYDEAHHYGSIGTDTSGKLELLIEMINEFNKLQEDNGK